MEPWPIVGRQSLIDESLARLGPEGAGVLLLGEAGVGKTRLARELAERLETDGNVVARVAGDQSASTIPLGGLSHLLPADVARRSMVDGRIEQSSMYHLARVEITALAGGGRPVIVADDANWLDELSLALLGQLARGGEITLLATMRGAVPPTGTLERLVSDGALASLTVAPLDFDDLRELLRRALGPVGEGLVADRLYEMSRGVPLYIRELVESSIAAGTLDLTEGRWRLTGSLRPSDHLTDLVESRLRTLDAHERRALEAIAVAGQLSIGIAAAIAPATVLEGLEARALIQIQPSRRRQMVGLAHPLHSEVLRSQLPALRARALRIELADALEATGARRRQDPMRIVDWRMDAGVEVAAPSLVEAARLCLAAHDHDGAERMARSAWAASDDPDAGVVLLVALSRNNEIDDAEALGRELTARDLTPEQLVTVARLRATNLLFWKGSIDAPTVIEQALERLEPSPERERLRAHLVEILTNIGWPRRALEAADGVVLTDTPSVQVELAGARAIASSMVGRPDEALASADEGLAIVDADRSGRYEHRSWLTNNRIIALTFDGRPHEAADLAETAMRSAVRRRARTAALWFAHWRSWVAFHLGEVDVAIEHGAEFASWSKEAGHWTNERWSVSIVAKAHLLRGDREAARPWVERALELDFGEHGLFHPDIDQAIVWMALADGRMDDALARLRGSVAVSSERGKVMFEAFHQHDLVRMGRAREAAPRLAELAADTSSPLLGALADLGAGLADGDDATIAGAGSRLESMGFVWLAAEAASLEAQLLDDQGKGRSATAAGQRADRLGAQMGGLRTPPMRRGDTVPLTPRERETALLAAEGLASKEIAGRLSVSVRTVDTHLARVYVKLGISGRSELAEALDPR